MSYPKSSARRAASCHCRRDVPPDSPIPKRKFLAIGNLHPPVLVVEVARRRAPMCRKRWTDALLLHDEPLAGHLQTAGQSGQRTAKPPRHAHPHREKLVVAWQLGRGLAVEHPHEACHALRLAVAISRPMVAKTPSSLCYRFAGRHVALQACGLNSDSSHLKFHFFHPGARHRQHRTKYSFLAL